MISGSTLSSPEGPVDKPTTTIPLSLCLQSTLLKLMVGTLEPLDGMVKRHNHLRIGQYHQHLTELLNGEQSPLEYMVRERDGCGARRLGPKVFVKISFVKLID